MLFLDWPLEADTGHHGVSDAVEIISDGEECPPGAKPLDMPAVMNRLSQVMGELSLKLGGTTTAIKSIQRLLFLEYFAKQPLCLMFFPFNYIYIELWFNLRDSLLKVRQLRRAPPPTPRAGLQGNVQGFWPADADLPGSWFRPKGLLACLYIYMGNMFQAEVESPYTGILCSRV